MNITPCALRKTLAKNFTVDLLTTCIVGHFGRLSLATFPFSRLPIRLGNITVDSRFTSVFIYQHDIPSLIRLNNSKPFECFKSSTRVAFLFYYEYIYVENTNVRENYCIHRLKKSLGHQVSPYGVVWHNFGDFFLTYSCVTPHSDVSSATVSSVLVWSYA